MSCTHTWRTKRRSCAQAHTTTGTQDTQRLSMWWQKNKKTKIIITEQKTCYMKTKTKTNNIVGPLSSNTLDITSQSFPPESALEWSLTCWTNSSDKSSNELDSWDEKQLISSHWKLLIKQTESCNWPASSALCNYEKNPLFTNCIQQPVITDAKWR